ncbi:hypothetical protein LguiB_014192 [Lonicera macranthoides]
MTTCYLTRFQDAQSSPCPLTPFPCRWRSPPSGIAKVNFDAAVFFNRKCFAIGAVIRDVNRAFLVDTCKKFKFLQDLLIAEAYEALHTILFALKCESPDVILEDDAEGILCCVSPSASTSSCNRVSEVRVLNHRDSRKGMEWITD